MILGAKILLAIRRRRQDSTKSPEKRKAFTSRGIGSSKRRRNFKHFHAAGGSED